MNQRNNQEDKFKNIVLKVEPARTHSPDSFTSHGVRPTFSPTNQTSYRPSPRHNPSVSNHLQITTSNVVYHPFGQLENRDNGVEVRHRSVLYSQNLGSHSSTLITSHVRDDQSMVARLQAQITEKEEIINQLKGLIRISNENSMKGMRSASMLARSGELHQQHQKQIAELKHSVKILTIQNNTLSDYIDKLKQTIGTKPVEYSNSKRDRIQSQHSDVKNQSEISRLNQVIADLQSNYDKKIDQFIVSHKSLAHQCKQFEEGKQKLEIENQKLLQKISELEQTHKKTTIQEKKGSSTEKFSIQKIKEQYAESLKQFKQTISIETEHLFDQFRSRLERIADNVSGLQEKIIAIENCLKVKDVQMSRKMKKSEIYIEEGGDSSMSDSSKRHSRDETSGCKPFTVSQLYEDLKDSEDEVTRPLKQQITRLKALISDLEAQKSIKNDSYGYKKDLRLKQEQIRKIKSSKEQKEKALLEDIEKLKAQINRLERLYWKEREQDKTERCTRQQIISDTQSQLDRLKIDYKNLLDESKLNRENSRFQSQLQLDNQRLRQELKQCIEKIEQYKKLCFVLRDQSEENCVQLDIFHQLKDQIYLIQEKHEADLTRLDQLEKDKADLLTVNRQMKVKLQDALFDSNATYQREQKIKQHFKVIQRQNQELTLKIKNHTAFIQNLENQLQQKKQAEKRWLEEKKGFERQIVGYLSLFHKISLDDSRTTRKSPTKESKTKEMEELIKGISQLEASFSELNSSRRQRRQKIIRMISDTSEWNDK